ncbi:MAG: DUF11 domain-containing protein, partial [Flavobacteriaceae bacterium]
DVSSDPNDPDPTCTGCTDVDTPMASADLVTVKTNGQTTYTPGTDVVYTITVTNNGPSDAINVRVQDPFPTGITVGTWQKGSGSINSGSLDDTTSSLSNGSSLVYTVTLSVPSDYTGNLTNVADVSSDTNDPDPTCTGCTDVDTPTGMIDLELVKNVDDITPNVGSMVTFSLVLSNNGPSDATGVAVEDILPVGYESIASIDNGGILTGNIINWTSLSIMSGSSITLTYTAIVAEPDSVTDQYKNIAQVVASDQMDIDSSVNNDNGSQSEDDEDSITLLPEIADLSLSKITTTPNPNVGDEITFTITVTNNGPSNATNIDLEDVLPIGYSYVPGTASSGGTYNSTNATLLWSGINLSVSGSITLQYNVIVNAPSSLPIPVDEYKNKAQIIASDQFDPNSKLANDDGDQSEDDEDSFSIVPQISDLSLVKTVNTTTAGVGDIITFFLSLSNNGPDDASNVTVIDNMPSGFEYVTHRNGTYDASVFPHVWDVGTILNGQTIVLEIDVRVLASTGTQGEYNNVAEVSGTDQFDPDSDTGNGNVNPGEDDTDDIGILVNLDLSVEKLVDEIAPLVNSEINFTINVTNNGPGIASNVQISESLASGYEYISHTVTNGLYDEFTGLWDIASISDNATETLIITVKVRESGDYLNTASLTQLDQQDSNPSNNESSLTPVPICLTIYNEFSPNGDNINDFFVIDCIDQYPNNTLEVFNRYGNTVFKKRNYDNTWDGTSNGRATIQANNKLPVGTYYYVLNLGNGTKPKTGWLYINR